ncbi:LLM class flavin-dependent oxidoreductase [Gordonia sp. NB41Y]|uniref:LLM class flavin-dependent oxidoreductase n=1 Tax=Gordonia sp. NB41Y TaxID=875808 RepID=UPI0006B15E3D|nr:LLM class flavin-dependent oxidoreductase [Gordonia sp. NB41Y]EMP11784.2 alkanesulfonate monooxygenase [Gordonia sp. NB41Y]WLP88450.1 LLM class flavin-dependent oxidoreductase [Gordonia sp. NB41Y]
MTTEFISLTFPNDSTELNPRPDSGLDSGFLQRYAQALDTGGFDYTLLPYHSSSFDPFVQAAAISQHTSHLKTVVALRPNTIYPTAAAKMLATLDQLSGGRVVVHIICGGDTVDQAREGDFLTKDDRYARAAEYIQILRRAWDSSEPFDFDGEYYTFADFSNKVRPTHGTIPVSIGGSSDAAYRVGGALADIFALWGEPLKETRDQIGRVFDEAAAAGRTDRPRIWVTFRPIVAETDEDAWRKAHRVLDALDRNASQGVEVKGPGGQHPENVGSQRLLEIAARGEVHDRALWYPTVTATGARGASTALVGSYDTVAESLVSYVDIGADLISIRGYDNLTDAITYGHHVLPRVRALLSESGAVATR